MQWLFLAAWWLIGIVSIAALSWQGRHVIRWIDLVLWLGVGVSGPIILLTILAKVLFTAEFWGKPIWPDRHVSSSPLPAKEKP